MRKIAHIINPFNANPSSDLYTAQPITFESMRRAKERVSGRVEVELWSAQYPEDRNMIPEGFLSTIDLDRSVLDLGTFEKSMKLPLIDDIVRRLYNESDAEYLIYTNVDIGVYPDFYEKVNQFIDEGLDAFIINRRRLPEHYTEVNQLGEIYEQKGKKHPGFDCFVFHRDLFKNFELAEVCIGVPFIGITFAQNIFALSKNYCLFEDERLTFHIGMEIFKGRAARDYFRYNRKQFWKAMNSSLNTHLSSKKWPYADRILPIRLIKWGLQPSLPIRLGLKLEWRRYFG
ncbi:MAG: hypothetical protein HWE22_18135 [Flavobacteriales bacterium]|nr:hypothetical protein [Flavobacteriales bacterium]